MYQIPVLDMTEIACWNRSVNWHVIHLMMTMQRNTLFEKSYILSWRNYFFLYQKTFCFWILAICFFFNSILGQQRTAVSAITKNMKGKDTKQRNELVKTVVIAMLSIQNARTPFWIKYLIWFNKYLPINNNYFRSHDSTTKLFSFDPIMTDITTGILRIFVSQFTSDIYDRSLCSAHQRNIRNRWWLPRCILNFSASNIWR